MQEAILLSCDIPLSLIVYMRVVMKGFLIIFTTFLECKNVNTCTKLSYFNELHFLEVWPFHLVFILYLFIWS